MSNFSIAIAYELRFWCLDKIITANIFIIDWDAFALFNYGIRAISISSRLSTTLFATFIMRTMCELWRRKQVTDIILFGFIVFSHSLFDLRCYMKSKLLLSSSPSSSPLSSMSPSPSPSSLLLYANVMFQCCILYAINLFVVRTHLSHYY